MCSLHVCIELAPGLVRLERASQQFGMSISSIKFVFFSDSHSKLYSSYHSSRSTELSYTTIADNEYVLNVQTLVE